MNLNPETVAAFKQILSNPKAKGFKFTPIHDFFEVSKKVTAKHILAKAYMDHVAAPLPKLVLYIIMDEIYGQTNAKDEKGNLGYFLQPKT